MEIDYTQIHADLKTLFAAVGEKIGQGAEFAWTTVMQQQYAIAFVDLIWAIFFMGVSIFFGILAKNLFKEYKTASYSEKDGYLAFGIVSTILTMIATAVAFAWLSDSVMHFINPNYYALEFFINLVKPVAR